jgi:hypothetical protein
VLPRPRPNEIAELRTFCLLMAGIDIAFGAFLAVVPLLVFQDPGGAGGLGGVGAAFVVLGVMCVLGTVAAAPLLVLTGLALRPAGIDVPVALRWSWVLRITAASAAGAQFVMLLVVAGADGGATVPVAAMITIPAVILAGFAAQGSRKISQAAGALLAPARPPAPPRPPADRVGGGMFAGSGR